MDKDLVSVIVPVYKVEKYLEKCINSILTQTYVNLEIILVDDGSPDQCGRICDEYSKKDSRIRVIHKKNGGLSDARNCGIEASTGEYIVFVDSDDYISNIMIESLYLCIKSNNSDMSLCAFELVDEFGKCIENGDAMPINTETISGVEIIKRMYLNNGGCYTVAWNKLYKRNLFDSIRFPKNRIHEDEFVSYKLFYLCEKVTCIKDKLYFYVQRDGSIMSMCKNSFSIGDLHMSEAMLERAMFFKNHNLADLCGKAYLNAAGYYKLYSKRARCAKKTMSKAEIDYMRQIKSDLKSNFNLANNLSVKEKIYVYYCFGIY